MKIFLEKDIIIILTTPLVPFIISLPPNYTNFVKKQNNIFFQYLFCSFTLHILSFWWIGPNGQRE